MSDKIDHNAFLKSVTRKSFMDAYNSNWHALYEKLIFALKDRPTAFVLKDCLEATRVIEGYHNFTSRLIKLPFEKALQVVDYIFENDIPRTTLFLRRKINWRSGYTIFNVVRDFVEMDDIDVALSLEQLPGTFQLWRRSNSIPGDYAKGAVFIDAVEDEAILKVEMLQKFVPRNQVIQNPVKGRGETLTGYIFRQSGGRYIMILRQPGRQHLRVTFFTEVAHEQDDAGRIGRVDWMNGKVMGIDANKPMVASVYMERVSNKTRSSGGDKNIDDLLSTLNVYSEPEVPPNVLKKLGREPFLNF